MLINHFMEKAENPDAPAANERTAGNDGQRVKVTDKTATGGWW